MICGKCKKEKPESEFTKLNRSKNGKRGLCKGCKKERDRKHEKQKKLKEKELPYFELIPDLVHRDKARVGVLNLYKFNDRYNTKDTPANKMLNIGLNAIIKELDEPFEYCDIKNINDYAFILISLTSVMDIENLIYTFEKFGPKDRKAKVIVGGFGVCNIRLIIPYIDIACFGRGEGQINDIIAGKRFNNVWRKEDDPLLQNKYEVRQTQYLVKGEYGVGCRNNCKYCQYTNVRLPINKDSKYNPGKFISSIESDWKALDVYKAGRYTSAWDGWSEDTRRRVCKPITDQMIINKLIDIGNRNITGGINIKIFQIVGYPWETKESVMNDINNWNSIFQYIDNNIKNRLVLSFLNTPFGPEPLTPMQYEPANINISWQNVLTKNTLFAGEHLMANIIPTISGAFTLLKRIFIHRSEVNDLELFKRIVFSSKLKQLNDECKIKYLLKYKIINKKMFGKVQSAGFDFLVPPTKGKHKIVG